MRKRISLMVITLLVVTGACAVLFTYGCGDGEDPAQAMLKAQGVTTPDAKSASTPDAPAATPSTGDAKSLTPAGAMPGGSKDEPAATAKPSTGAPEDKAADGKPGDKKDAAKPDAKKKDGAGELSEDERIVNFQNLDPRDIIIKKYENLAELHTEPWNAEKSEEDFIPETGRIDPLNPVNSAIPDELKPPRTGATDESLIQTYLVSVACTAAVDSVRQMVRVFNVLKIGAQKYVSIGIGGQRGSIEVGQSFGFMAGSVGNIPIMVQLTIASATESEVVIDVTASGSGTATSVSKTQVFIPRGFSG